MKASAFKARDLLQKRTVGLIAVVLGFVFCVGSILAHIERNAIYGVDFRAVYSCSRCLVAGCNPYSSAETMAEFLKHGGTVKETGPPPKVGAFVPHFAAYPPFALFYFVPFAMLPWPIAWAVYMTIATPLFLVAVFLFARLCSDYTPLAANLLLAVFIALGGYIFTAAQPALLAASLCCIAIWCLLNDRFPRLSVFCFALSLVLKPHLGGILLLYFFLATARYRKRAFQIAATAIVMSLPGLIWVSLSPTNHNWLQDYRVNLHALSSAGNLNDPGPTNSYATRIVDLQSIFSLVHNDPAFYNSVAWMLCLLLLAVWIYGVIRLKPSRDKDLICIAAIAFFTLLPVYHRTYDCRLLIITFPALALLWEKAPGWGRVSMVLMTYLTIVTSDHYIYHSNSDAHWLRWTHDSRIWVVLLERPVPLSCLLLTIFYLAVLYAPLPSLNLVPRLSKQTS